MVLVMSKFKNACLSILVWVEEPYKDFDMRLRRKIRFNIFVICISLIAASLFLANILMNQQQSMENPGFFVGVIVTLLMNLFLVRKGIHWLPIICYSAILISSYFSYFRELQAGQDVIAISMYGFICVIWVFIAYRWWHWVVLVGCYLLVMITRLSYIYELQQKGDIDIDIYLATMNAYFILSAVVILTLVISYYMDREYQFTMHEFEMSQKTEKMYKSIVETYNDSNMLEALSDAHVLEAYFDTLTGCLNNLAFNKFFKSKYSQLKSHDDLCISYMDLNNLKYVNDHLGHHSGDTYITYLVESIEANRNSQDVLYRIGGDEFVMVSVNKDITMVTDLMESAQKLFSERCQAINIDGRVSYGVVHSGNELYETIDEMIKEADSRMYAMKMSFKEMT